MNTYPLCPFYETEVKNMLFCEGKRYFFRHAKTGQCGSACIAAAKSIKFVNFILKL